MRYFDCIWQKKKKKLDDPNSDYFFIFFYYRLLNFPTKRIIESETLKIFAYKIPLSHVHHHHDYQLFVTIFSF